MLEMLELEAEDEKPPSFAPTENSWLVAVLANIKDDDTELPSDVPADALADFDHIETIRAIQAAIESAGHRTVFIQADSNLPYALKNIQPDICFNIAEGLGGDGREAQVPGILEMLRIPYTGSRVVTNAVSLDKTLTKRIWRDRRLPVAPFQEFSTGDEPLRPDLRFPLFVKPAREGTGMGVDTKAIVNTETELRERTRWIIQTYHQPALVEHYLPGREFTVAVMGRADSKRYSRHPEWYDVDGFHRFPIMELDSSCSITPGIYSNAAKSKDIGEDGAPEFYCPAQLDDELAKKLQYYAWRAHNVLGAHDISRVDIRLDAKGQPCLIEINTLPGLTPNFSDLCVIANADGISYEELILEILYLGAARWGLLEARKLSSSLQKANGSRVIYRR
jgi:D-alanine-D-alanine ligase